MSVQPGQRDETRSCLRQMSVTMSQTNPQTLHKDKATKPSLLRMCLNRLCFLCGQLG
jgi:hypothetical protein